MIARRYWAPLALVLIGLAIVVWAWKTAPGAAFFKFPDDLDAYSDFAAALRLNAILTYSGGALVIAGLLLVLSRYLKGMKMRAERDAFSGGSLVETFEYSKWKRRQLRNLKFVNTAMVVLCGALAGAIGWLAGGWLSCGVFIAFYSIMAFCIQVTRDDA